MVNDEKQKNANAIMKIITVGEEQRLCLSKISTGVEVRFDYGVPDLPWRKRTVNKIQACKVQVLLAFY